METGFTKSPDNVRNPWLPYSRSCRSPQMRLFCFPYAGASAIIFRSWSNFFDATIEICPVQLPGRGSRSKEPPFTNLEALLTPLVNGIVEWLDKPFAFFGHSMGAIICFEVAQRLKAYHGLIPAHLFVSGAAAPQIARNAPLMYNLSRPQFIERLYQLEGTPVEILANEELLCAILPLLRSDFELIETYKYIPKPKLPSLITALGGSSDKDVTFEDIHAWREHTSLGFYSQMLPGNHFFIHGAEDALLNVIAQRLRQTTIHSFG